jgi:hypothetical protein
MALMSHKRLQAMRPSLALCAGPALWILCQQGAGDLVYASCQNAGPPLGPLLGIVTAALCAAAAWVSWSGRRAAATPAQALLCRVGAGAGILFTLGCLGIAASTIVIPPCVR